MPYSITLFKTFLVIHSFTSSESQGEQPCNAPTSVKDREEKLCLKAAECTTDLKLQCDPEEINVFLDVLGRSNYPLLEWRLSALRVCLTMSGPRSTNALDSVSVKGFLGNFNVGHPGHSGGGEPKAISIRMSGL